MMFHIIKQIVRPLASSPLRQLSSTTTMSPYREEKIKVLDTEINVIESTESDPNSTPIFYLPGAFGSIEMDFKPIMHAFNSKKYKWISWDPPGYGKSRPPKREFLSKRYECVNVLDVDYIKELMDLKGYPQYTLLGWSGAALSAIIIAAKYPERVSSLITWGAFGYVAPEMMPGIVVLRKAGLAAIPEPRKSQLSAMYGEDCLLEMWHGWCDEAVRMFNSENFKKGGSFQNVIADVKCPALVIHGKKDNLVDFSMAEHLNSTLKNSRLHTMENGTHNLHLRCTNEFVQCIQQFVDQASNRSKL